MNTHKTKVEYISALQYKGTNVAELKAFCGELYFDDATTWFPEETWAVGLKAVWIRPYWRTINNGDWVIKKDGKLDSTMSLTEFEEVYESV